MSRLRARVKVKSGFKDQEWEIEFRATGLPIGEILLLLSLNYYNPNIIVQAMIIVVTNLAIVESNKLNNHGNNMITKCCTSNNCISSVNWC